MAFQLDPRVFDYVLNVVTTEGGLRWRMHAAPLTYRQDVLLTRTSHDPVSTAVHKLEEALAVLGFRLDRHVKAIDLGESTQVLGVYLRPLHGGKDLQISSVDQNRTYNSCSILCTLPSRRLCSVMNIACLCIRPGSIKVSHKIMHSL